MRALTKYFFVFLCVTLFSSYSVGQNTTNLDGNSSSMTVNDYINEEYENIGIETILNQEYLVLVSSSMVNTCYALFPVINKKVSKSSLNLSEPLCNYKVVNGHVVSRWRNGAKWYEKVYQVDGIQWKPLLIDECVDCGEVKRTIYKKDNNEVTMVTDAPEYNDRQQLFGVVIASKVLVTSRLQTAQPTKLEPLVYLHKGNEFQLKDRVVANGETMYRIVYTSPGGKENWYWINSVDFDLL